MEAEAEQPRRRARNLLSSYYGAEVATPAAHDELDDMDIDSTSFDADKYVENLLQYKSLEELVQRGNAMVSEIKSLDSDMQMLVYENYNKFISATDTIRKMKHRVEGMEAQMAQLEGNMGAISSASDSVNVAFSGRRAQARPARCVCGGAVVVVVGGGREGALSDGCLARAA